MLEDADEFLRIAIAFLSLHANYSKQQFLYCNQKWVTFSPSNIYLCLKATYLTFKKFLQKNSGFCRRINDKEYFSY